MSAVMPSIGSNTLSDSESRAVVFSVTGVLGSSIKDRTVRTSVREVKVPYSQMNSTMQSILRSGAKIVNVSVIP
ncbi:MAG: phycobilisome linker polypeptide [Pseudanabaenaceae cyanobacterium]|jgi:hypothetical protein